MEKRFRLCNTPDFIGLISDIDSSEKSDTDSYKKQVYKASRIPANPSSTDLIPSETMAMEHIFDVRDMKQNFLALLGFSNKVFTKRDIFNRINLFGGRIRTDSKIYNCFSAHSINYGDKQIVLATDNYIVFFERTSGINTGAIAVGKNIHITDIIDLVQDLNGDLVVITTKSEYRYGQNKKFISERGYKSPIALADKFSIDEEICRVVPFAKKYYAVFLDNFKNIRIYDKSCSLIHSAELFETEPEITALNNGDLVLLWEDGKSSLITIIRDANIAKSNKNRMP